MLKPAQIGIFLLLTILFSEYGFRFRRRTVQYLHGGWKWYTTLIRVSLWAAAWRIVDPDSLSVLRLGLWAVAVLYGELTVWLVRHHFRQSFIYQRPYGTIITHIAPIVSSLVLTLAFYAAGESAGERIPEAFPGLPLRVIAPVTAAIALFTWATMLTASVGETVHAEPPEPGEGIRPGADEMIGLMERILVFCLVLAGAYTVVGMVLVAKAIVGFPRFEERRAAERFWIGTLCSVGIAAILGMLVGAARW